MILFKKAMRSIWRGKRSYIACIALMAIGIMVYTAFHMLYINLNMAKDKMYTDQNFADAFAKVRGMPLNAAAALGEIEGVRRAGGSITADARVMIPGKDEKIITLRLQSFDPEEQNPLNAFLITDGTSPRENEVIVGEPFADANSLSAGDTLKLVIAGREITVTVSGTAQSPEYVYAIPDTGQLMPDNEAFGFGFITYAQLATVTGKTGLCDSISLKLEDGIKFEELKPQLEDALNPYGMISLYPRKDQPSASMLATEINSLGSMATSMPMVFILMAVIILYIMLKRVIEQERGSIGMLKAFGFSDGEVLTHYLCYGLITGALGGLLGCLFGFMMAGSFTQIYLEYFNLPALTARADPLLFLQGLLIAVLSGAAGAFMGTRSMLKLNPSEAMRPPSPRAVTKDALAGMPFLRHVLASNGYMAMRNITRSVFRSLFIVVGVAFSFAMIAFTSSYPDMMDKMLIEQFSKVQLYDVKVTLKEPRAFNDAIEAVYGAGEVTVAEGLLEIPAEARLDHLKKGVIITAMEPGSALLKIYDSAGAFTLEPREGGLIISGSLADKLEAARGDTLMIKTPYSGDEEIPVPVLGVVNEYLGTNAYICLDSMCELLNVPKSANSVIIGTKDIINAKNALTGADNVASVTDQSESRKVYDDMMATYSSIFVMMQLAGMGVAFAIITNTASVSLSERKREYATLRVLGMYPREIAKILGFEYWLLTLLGFIPGIPLVRMLKSAISGMMDTSLFTFPLDTPLSCYITAAAGCLLTVALCNFLAARNIAKFDMVEVLKERE